MLAVMAAVFALPVVLVFFSRSAGIANISIIVRHYPLKWGMGCGNTFITNYRNDWGLNHPITLLEHGGYISLLNHVWGNLETPTLTVTIERKETLQVMHSGFQASILGYHNPLNDADPPRRQVPQGGLFEGRVQKSLVKVNERSKKNWGGGSLISGGGHLGGDVWRALILSYTNIYKQWYG